MKKKSPLDIVFVIIVLAFLLVFAGSYLYELIQLNNENL